MEPSDCRTVCIRPVMPPKREATIRVPLSEAYLAKLMAEEAKSVRARFTSKYGNFTSNSAGIAVNEQRQQEAVEARTALAAEALKVIAKAPITSAALREMFRKSENQMRAATGMLSHEGKIESVRHGRNAVWRVTQ